eukprot:PhM_4_TR11550/c0_g1_i2/m.83916
MANAGASIEDLYPKYIPDPHGCIDANGKSIIDLSHPAVYNITEKKELTDAERMTYKQFELYRLLKRMERRDNVFQALTTSDFTNTSTVQLYLGTPYPVIEPNPHVFEVYWGIRWYEHVLAGVAGAMYFLWARTKPGTRYGSLLQSSKWLGVGWGVLVDWGWTYRSLLRLTGQSPNEAECFKYGVLESPERLKEKADLWRQYAEYKDEWMRRYNYHVWGMRPGETFSFFSAMHAPPLPVRYNTRFDYPRRKNPYVVHRTDIQNFKLDLGIGFGYTSNDPFLSVQRPDTKYLRREVFETSRTKDPVPQAPKSSSS